MKELSINIVENERGKFPSVTIYNIVNSDETTFNVYINDKKAFKIYTAMLLKCGLKTSFIREHLYEYSIGLYNSPYIKHLDERNFHFQIFYDEPNNEIIVIPVIDGEEKSNIYLKLSN